MEEMIPHNWTDVKKVKFHHKVKRFYHKNLFRKIYTVAIIGLIGANVFSMMKYSSFADEYENLQPVQEMDYLDTEGLQNADIQYTDVAGNVKYIMAKNLGATSSNINSSDSYGNFYQWGNDYAYPRYVDSEYCNLDGRGNGECPLDGYDSYPQQSLSIQGLDPTEQTDYNRFQEYLNYNNGDTDGYQWEEGAQGPCPEGYHVPTFVEWGNLFLQWCEDSDVCDTRMLRQNGPMWYLGGFDYDNLSSLGNGNGRNSRQVLNAFMQEYKLPLAGYRTSNNVEQAGYYGYYWSSPFRYMDEYVDYALDFNLADDFIGMGDEFDGNGGLSVRCVAGEYDSDKDPIPLAIDFYLGEEEELPLDSLSTSSLNIDENGWMGRIFIPANQPIPDSKLAKLDIGYDWYYVDEKNPDYKVDSDEWSDGISLEMYWQSVDPDTQTLHLYGFPSCDDDEQYVNGECVPVKWGTTVNEHGNYECLAEGATYDEVSGQCVYTAKNINGKAITLMSSNLGATELNPMGDFYQWGRNQRFSRYNPDIDSSDFYNYDSELYNWSEGDQGPCPEGYHVPNMDEWNNLFLQWCEDSDICDTRDMIVYGHYRSLDVDMGVVKSISSLGNGVGMENTDITDIIDRFISMYNIRFAGDRGDYVWDAGNLGYHWSSTLLDIDNAGIFKNSYELVGYYTSSNFSRNLGIGLSLRCFKDSDDEDLQAVALDLYEVENVEAIENGGWNNNMIGRIFVANGQSIPSFKKSGLDQYRWYMYDDNDELQQIDINAKVFSVNMDEEPEISLFALPLCDEDEEWDATTNTCRTACLGKGSTYDAEADLCYYTATDLDGNEMKIMDANLGATRANPMGDFFQWGNDYMYPRICQGNGYCELFGRQDQLSLGIQTLDNLDQTDYERFQNYRNNDGYTWEGDENMQGPCPSGYHVPTIDERQNIFISRCEENDECDAREMINYWQNADMVWGNDNNRIFSRDSTIGEVIEWCEQSNDCDMDELMNELNRYIENGSEYEWLFRGDNGKYVDMMSSFMEDYNLSLAGGRDVNYVNGIEEWGGYWSSKSVHDDEGAQYFDINPVSVYRIGVSLQERAYGYSVRCIANEKRSSTPIALDLFIGGDDTDEELYLENADWVGRKFVGSGSSVDVNKLTAAAVDLPSPDEGMEWVWYLINEQDEAERITASTRISENTKVYAFQEAKTDTPDSDQPDTPSVQPTQPSTPVNNYSGGGRKVTKAKDTHNSADEKDSTQNDAKGSENTKTPTNSSSSASEGQTQNLDMSQYNATYTPEQNTAYQFAKSHGITTTSSIREAKMNTPLTRIEMAKMLSYYAVNVLGMVPQHGAGVARFSDVPADLDEKYDNGVALAYQLGIMGINMPNNEFRPNDKVTRAEFATALSRMIYGMEDGKGRVRYYEPHIARLYNEGIINVTNPKMQELRGNVMTMLMRTEK